MTGAMVGNFVMVGVGTAILEPIDTASGAAYAYPKEITVSFGQPAPSKAAPDTGKATPIDSTAAIDTPAPPAK
ncbi:hypothetical protein DWV00_25875 [Trinickia dinghuensis]|uniref:Uncharacterized protein n=2 Tax=Trinickia dinghuensis TaxID=2291023 RepID=A0A3D8JSH6_9BURK|nr:hypothetical protein DWV00_25875 [Trinickia dinghuensis]